MKVSYEKSYWANSVGVIGVMFALAFMVRSCCDVNIESQKTRQIEIQKGIGVPSSSSTVTIIEK